jgi:hypothetical protein
MIKYEYQKVKGFREKKFIENGHTMFEEDVLQRLKRLAYLEEQIKENPIISIGHQNKQLEIAWKALEWVGFVRGEEFDDDDINKLLGSHSSTTKTKTKRDEITKLHRLDRNND